jgi:(2Fe-2S) ferredoxin
MLLVVVGPAGRPVRPRTQHDYYHYTKVKPEAATAVIELLMMGGKRPKHVEL